jgi:hypothetical protein
MPAAAAREYSIIDQLPEGAGGQPARHAGKLH